MSLQMGTHDDLLARQGFYANLIRQQEKREEEKKLEAGSKIRKSG